VAAVNFGAPEVSFLWHNVVGAVTVVLVGLLLSAVAPTAGDGSAPHGTVGTDRA
jgi:hypothetical protein